MKNKPTNVRMKGCGMPTRKLLQLEPQTIIKQLQQAGMLCKDQFQFIIQSSISVLKFQPNVIKITSPVIVVGDIHGQFFDLLTVFRRHGFPPQTKYVFLGDYVDRGQFSIQVLTLLIWLKLKYPKNIYLLRGNHQCRVLTNTHNFKNQCKSKYNLKIYELVIILFQVLPICCIVDNKYFCVHAGISPSINSIQQIQKISRFCQIPEKGALCDLLWSDPTDEDKKQWTYNSNRSCSYFYSKDHALNFLKKNNLQMIIRGHEVQLQGYKYLHFKKSNKKNVLTIFSAPHYCDKYNNLGAVALIQNNDIRIDTYKNVEHPYVLPNNLNIFEWSIEMISRQAVKILIQLAKNRLMSQKPNKEQIDKIQLCKQMEQIKILLQQGDKSDKQLCKSTKLQYKPTSQNELQPNNCLATILMFICQKKSDEKQEGMPVNQEIKQQIKQQERRIYSALILKQNKRNNIQHKNSSNRKSKDNIFPSIIQNQFEQQTLLQNTQNVQNIKQKDNQKQLSKLTGNQTQIRQTNYQNKTQKNQIKQNTVMIFGPKISQFTKICPKRK